MDTTPDSTWHGQVQALLRSKPASRHLSEDDWLAIAEGQPHVDNAAAALQHLARCQECRDLLRAMCLLRAEAPPADNVGPLPSRRWWWAGAALAASLVAAAGLWLLAPSIADPTAGGSGSATPGSSSLPPAAVIVAPSSSPPATAVPTPAWLRPVPPAIALYSPGLLTKRGGDTSPFADAFGEAIEPWQAGNHAEAALRLDALARQYPAVAEAHFYRGAAWLLAGVPDEAVAPLRRAVALAPSALQADASWYLGLALMQTQRLDDAVRVFDTGCTAGDTRACRAARHLDASAQMPRE